MEELQLRRSTHDSHLYELAGVGSLRLEGWTSSRATARAGDSSWRVVRKGLFVRRVEARDASEAITGTFVQRSIRRGGDLTWNGRELKLRPSSLWRERYALADGEVEFALIDAVGWSGWGKRPVKVTLDAVGDPGLLLFAVYIVRGLADDASAAAGASVGTTTAGG